MSANIVQLNIEEWTFIGEYLIDSNGKRAIIAAGYQGLYPSDAAYKMMKRAHVAAELKRASDAMRANVGLSAEMVVTDIANVLKADPRDLIQFVTGACRHCYGEEHEYQFTNGEFKRAQRAAHADNREFNPQGGPGYNAYRDPHDACPECYGHGVQRPQLKDTRTLDPVTASLYAGIKQTKHGIELVLRSKDAARDAAAKFLGMNKETLDINVARKLEDYTDAELIALMNEKK